MIEIEIVKCPQGRDTNNTFSNRYLLATSLDYKDDAVKEAAKNIKDAERRLYHTRVQFMGYIVRGLDARGKAIPGASKSSKFTDGGLVAITAATKMAPAHVCAAIAKESYNGAAAITPYRHCVTADEYAAYSNAGTIPDRFKDPDGPADFLAINFIEAIKNAIGTGPIRHTLPYRQATPTGEPRLVEEYTSGGIILNQPTRTKKSGIKNARAAAQQRINEKASKARYAQRRDSNGAIPDGADGMVRTLRAEAVAIFNQLPADEQSRIIWPEIFDRNPLSGGV